MKNKKFSATIIILLAFFFIMPVFATNTRLPGEPQLGTNLSGPADWSSEMPFSNVFRISREWISQKEGEGWGKGPKLDLDEYGWVKHLEPGCSAETVLCCIDGGHYPSGDYTVYYEGQGEITLANAGRVKEIVRPGLLIAEVDSSRGAIFLKILKTDPADSIRNIRVMLPGCDDDRGQDGSLDFDKLWNPAFLKRWRGVTALRFMDWMQTNGSKVATWEDRPMVDHATWSPGVPLEVMCDLSNRLEADPWFCMPHLADDRYIWEFAAEAKRLVAPQRKIYVEYSNEVWNGQFEQSRYAGEKGIEMKLAEKPWEAAWKYTGIRSRQIFSIWYNVFGADAKSRLVRVLATQAANAYVSDRILESDDAGKFADALAIAPYMTDNISPEEAEKVVAGGLDGIFERLKTRGLPEAIDWMKAQKESANQYDLALVCYEAGQHLVGIYGAENNEHLTELLHKANRDPRMGEAYTEYYRAWEQVGGGLLCNFSSVGVWSKWGSWGLAETMDQKPDSIPKFKATLDWAQSLGQRMERE